MSGSVTVAGDRPQGAAVPARGFAPGPGRAGRPARGQLWAGNGLGGGGVRVDRIMSGYAGGTLAAAGSPLEPAGNVAGGLVCADDLPDGLVIADHAGRATVFNQAASRLTGISPDSALGGGVQQVLPLRADHDRCRWTQTRPYDGLVTTTRPPA